MKNLLESYDQLLSEYQKAAQRQFWLDYDGSLVPFADRPLDATPSPDLRKLLKDLASDPGNQVIIISGRDTESLSQCLGDLPLDLVAEHGAFLRRRGCKWEPFVKIAPNWKAKVRTSLKALAGLYEGSFVEEKKFSLVWHYRAIVDRVWPEDVLQVMEALRALRIDKETSLYAEACAIEVRSKGIDKGSFIRSNPWSDKKFDFGLVLGDGNTDEDLFKHAPESYFTVKVSPSSESVARFFLAGQDDVLPLLRSLTTMTRGMEYA